MKLNNIRNFAIISHIDHGKSTLADRFLELTQSIETRKMKEQVLDSMDIERERGITIKMQPVRMEWSSEFQISNSRYILNLIDTPGHVDFSYEVSRSIAACEGALLIVDAAQSIQAQTISNLYLALENDLEIIPVLNKIDLPAADPEGVSGEVVKLLGCKSEEILQISAKDGRGVKEVIDKVIERVPSPEKSFNVERLTLHDQMMRV